MAMQQRLKTSVIINNYNYARYIDQALHSVFAQTVPFDEVIIVDDGSTDDSLAVIRACSANASNVTIVAKENEGQLSCINEGFKRSTGDIIFFLDSDDLFTEQYLEKATAFYQDHEDCDYLFTAVREFGDVDREKMYCKEFEAQTGRIGFSLLRTLYGNELIGVPTSTISSKREYLARILPFENYQEWKICADDYIAFGTSLAGAQKYILPEALVKYRVHGKNNWAGAELNINKKYQKKIGWAKVISSLKKQFELDGDLGNLILTEYRSIPYADLKLTRFYLKLANDSKSKDRAVIKRKIRKKYLKRTFRNLFKQ